MNQGPPYAPSAWALGGRNEKSVDVPITAVFLVLFIIGAACHMTIFQLNKKRGHKFIFSAVLFGKRINFYRLFFHPFLHIAKHCCIIY